MARGMGRSKGRSKGRSMAALPTRSLLLSRLVLPVVIAIGLMLLAVSCAPASVGGGSSDPSAPGATTGLVVDRANTESSSFVVQWAAPVETGTKSDGAALSPEEIGYRIYYLVETAIQTEPNAEPVTVESVTAESIRKNPSTQIKELMGFLGSWEILQARITKLEPETRYFVTIASYNFFSPQLEAILGEVVEASTSAATLDLGGSLVYTETAYEFDIGLDDAITPTDTPTIPAGGGGGVGGGVTVSYTLEKIDGAEFVSELATTEAISIAEDSAVIMINSITNAGTARYFVRAKATGYTTQDVMLTIVVKKADLAGGITYIKTAYEFDIGLDDTITPATTPTIPNTDTSNGVIRYNLDRRTGVEFSPMPTIDGDGVITINSINNTGIATYLVQASADGYATQETILKIVVHENIFVSTYHSSAGEATDMFPVEIGQAIVDDGTFALADDSAIISVAGPVDESHTIHFGLVVDGEVDDYSGGNYQKIASNGVLTILKSDLAKNAFSFSDGAAIGISGPSFTDIEHIATYRPSKIYGSRDLQAMRKNLSGSYMLTRNIEFPSANVDSGTEAGTVVSNYEAVGDTSNPFTGSLDGAGYGITGLAIEGSNDHQGLFGVMEASSVNAVLAQNLALKDFKITGSSQVGSLAGWVKRGTVDGVRVDVSNADAGKIEVGSNKDDGSFGGGLVGRTGTDGIDETNTIDVRVRIQNTSSATAVFGTGIASNGVGGLVGRVGNDVELTESFATGSVSGVNDVGGLAGDNGGTVSGYATGLVTGNNNVGGLVGYSTIGTVSGHAIGLVTGNNNVGGLVGNSVGDAVSGYATGSVTGAENVGGLIGHSTIGTASGYATGSVLGFDTIGGLVGWNNRSTVAGYATGLISGNSNIGGLVGSNESGSFSRGYATGSVSGNANIGGLMGYNNGGTVSGYARGVVRRIRVGRPSFGKTIGVDYGISTTYSSGSESQVYDGETGTAMLPYVIGKDGTEVTIAGSMQAAFLGLVFGDSVGKWTWVDDGKWPAMNIGDEIKPAAEQPVNPPDGS